VGIRRDARELALKCLHQWDQRPGEGRELSEELIQRFSIHVDQTDYCRRLLEAYWDNARDIDERIQIAADNWRLDRMAIVDRSILRLATAEMLALEDVPARVSLDEAIELAKQYSTEKSGAFVNGILDRILNDVQGPSEIAPPAPGKPAVDGEHCPGADSPDTTSPLETTDGTE